MNLPVYVYDPTASDSESKVRGVGSYLQSIREIFSEEFYFTNKVSKVPGKAIFINPFFNPIKKPLKVLFKNSRRQIAVIHDVIPLKYPKHFPIGLKGKFYRFLNWISLNNYDIILTDSEHSKRDIIRILGVPARKIIVIYPTVKEIFRRPMALSQSYNDSMVDPDEQDGSFKKSFHATHLDIHQEQSTIVDSIPFEQYCIYVGDGTWNKNLMNMAKGIQVAQTPCVVVGKVFTDFRKRIESSKKKKPYIHPEEKELYEFYKYTKNNSLFYFTGYVSDHDLVLLYKKANVNVLVSYDEGFGLSYAESAFLGTPSVLAATPLFKEVAKQDAVYARYNDPNDIGDKVRRLFFRSNTYHKHLRVDSFERAYDFGPDIFRKSLLEVIERFQKR